MNSVKKLLTYRYSEIIYDLTAEFCRKYRTILSSGRTFDQMVQAARSGKQNIVEGVGQSATSKRGEMKLLGVAKASLEELLADYEDFLRQQKLAIYPKADSKITGFRQIAYRLSDLSNLSSLGNLIEAPTLPADPETAANFLLTLCHLATFLLDKQIKALENKFAREGGFTEKLYRSRIGTRNSGQ